MKMCISIIHLGRYRIEMLDNRTPDSGLEVVRGYDCGLAGVLVALNNWIFVPEHVAYQGDQRKSSNELGNEVMRNMLKDKDLNPKGLTPPVAKPYKGTPNG